MYKEKRLVITSKERQQCIIHDVHEGLGSDPKARAMAVHRGRETTYQKIAERFWYNIVNDVSDYIKKCDTCQKHKAMPKVISQELHGIPVPSQVMKHIGIAICNLPEVGGFKHLVVCIDYFSKWSEAKPLRDKSAPTIAQFLYELMSPWMRQHSNQ